VIPASSLTLTAEMHEIARRHLFPGDGLEAAAILVCARTPGPRTRLLARSIVLVPHDQCSRKPYHLRWPGAAIEQAIDLGDPDNLSLILLHSHPGDFLAFSEVDNESDRMTMPSLFHAINAVHGSAIMVPSGAILARLYQPNLVSEIVDLVTVPGHDLNRWWGKGDFATRPMAFTSDATKELSRLRAGVIGVSGTGSIIAEQAARLGFGEVLLMDFDKTELRNLNRILNTTLDDAKNRRLKVEVFARAIADYRGRNVAICHSGSITERNGVLAASQCDVLFCCVDTRDARQLIDLIASAFLIPLFDMGVTIPTRKDEDGNTVVLDVCSRIDYVRPGGPTLQDRGVYTQESLREEHLRRSDPDAHKRELDAGYIKGSEEEAPSVLTLNMRAAADTMMEFWARAFPFRHDGNAGFARRQLSIAAGEEEFFPESEFSTRANPLLARGDQEPLLLIPRLSAVGSS
jgi:hypothetical protein